MKNIVLGLLAGASLLVVTGREAGATTAAGTLITNVATATFVSFLGTGYDYTLEAMPSPISFPTAWVLVLPSPTVALEKYANPTTAAPGSQITFTLWAVNTSLTLSAFNVTITDRMPNDVAYSDNEADWPGIGGVTFTPGVWTRSVSGDNVAYVGGNPSLGQGTPYYMRWFLSFLGPGESAFVQFTADIL